MKTKFTPAIGVLACVLAGSAYAADMPVKAPPVAVFSWAGCYGGINAGWIGGRTWSDLQPGGLYLAPAGAAAPPNAAGTGALPIDRVNVTHGYATDDSSWEAGVQVGCQNQWGVVVGGFEADWQWSGISNGASALYAAIPSQSPGFTIAPHVESVSNRLDWFSTYRGRLGFTPWTRMLLYGTAGIAVSHESSSTAVGFGTFPVLPVYNTATHFGSDSRVKVGAVAGVGGEYAFWNNWSVKAEVLYFWYSGLSYNSPLVFPTPPAAAIGYLWNTNINSHEVVARLGLNYRFWSW